MGCAMTDKERDKSDVLRDIGFFISEDWRYERLDHFRGRDAIVFGLSETEAKC